MLILIIILAIILCVGGGIAAYFIIKNKKKSAASSVWISHIPSSGLKQIGSMFFIPTAFSDQSLEEEIVWLKDHKIGTDPTNPNILVFWNPVPDEVYKKAALAADLHRKNGLYFGVHIPANESDKAWIEKLWTFGIIRPEDKQVAIYLDPEMDLAVVGKTDYMTTPTGKAQIAWFTSAVSIVESLLGADQKLTVVLSPCFIDFSVDPNDLRAGYAEFLATLVGASTRGNQYVSAVQDGVGSSDKPSPGPIFGVRVPGDDTLTNLFNAHYNACDDAGVKGLVNLELFSYNSAGEMIVAAYSRISEQIKWEVENVSGPCWVFNKTAVYDLTEFKQKYNLGE